MKKNTNNSKKWRGPLFLFKVFFIGFLILFARASYLALSPTIDNINMSEFAKNRNTVKMTLPAVRGNILDSKGNVLAQSVSSYTVIAYLDESRSSKSSKPLHVVDKELTAASLAPILNMEETDILKLLERNVYQVELGPGGRGITELTKEKIVELELPGIGFIETKKRWYPNGDFASYLLGYAKQQEDGEIVGELALEAHLDSELKGTDGYLEYQRDRFGYKIIDTKERRTDPIAGNDVYLTIDTTIQRFVETAVKDTQEKYHPEWFIMTIMDAKTGAILASASTPSFDPNQRNIKQYENPLVSYTYEPGSTMKIFTYMAALEKGTYNGNATFKSGTKTISGITIKDWNEGKGWGTINYDTGFTYSSNIGIANILENFIDKNDLKEYFTKLGFGQTTGINLPREFTGKISFNYAIEVSNAGFGQGITTTPIQHLQALSSIANEGRMLKPYIIDKIVNPTTKEVIFEAKTEVVGTVASKATIDKIKDLMYLVVNNDDSIATGRDYKIEGFDVIGKTGTAQVYNTVTKEYDKGVIYSFSGMYPKDSPEIIVYTAMKKPTVPTNRGLKDSVKEVFKNIAKYLNHFPEQHVNQKYSDYTLSSYINKKTESIEQLLVTNKLKPIVLGSGDKIIKQYPNSNTKVIDNEKIFLVTNNNDVLMPNIKGWSKKEVLTFCELSNITCNLEGYGYVISFDIAVNTALTKESILTISLEEKQAVKTTIDNSSDD